MINLLIIGNDVSLTKELLKNISSKDLASCDKTSKSKISKLFHIKESDILFLNQETINTYNSSSLEQCKNKLISIAFEENQRLSHKSLSSICDLAKNRINEKRLKIAEELEKVGYNFKYKGTQYLLDTILEIQKDDIVTLDSLQGTYYPSVAKKYNKTVHNIKNCIISATNNMYYESDIEILKKYFHLYEDERPSIRRVVYTIASKIYG